MAAESPKYATNEYEIGTAVGYEVYRITSGSPDVAEVIARGVPVPDRMPPPEPNPNHFFTRTLPGTPAPLLIRPTEAQVRHLTGGKNSSEPPAPRWHEAESLPAAIGDMHRRVRIIGRVASVRFDYSPAITEEERYTLDTYSRRPEPPNDEKLGKLSTGLYA